jgi:hypothetical protein
MTKKVQSEVNTSMLNYVKEQTGFHLHELIGRTIILSFTEESRTTSAHKIVGASILSRDNSEGSLGDNAKWRFYITLESNVIRSWASEGGCRQLLIEEFSLYIRRQEWHEFEATFVI